MYLSDEVSHDLGGSRSSTGGLTTSCIGFSSRSSTSISLNLCTKCRKFYFIHTMVYPSVQSLLYSVIGVVPEMYIQTYISTQVYSTVGSMVNKINIHSPLILIVRIYRHDEQTILVLLYKSGIYHRGDCYVAKLS